MKKWIFIVLTALIFPQYISANCINVAGSCKTNEVECRKGLCCDTQQECTNITQQINKDREETKKAQQQVGNPLCNGLGVNTALGCLMAGDPKVMVSQLLGWGTIVGAGIAFLMIIFAGIQIVLAGGDPKKVQAARELITSAITGLILIIFSVFLLNLIGIGILGLDTLGFKQ